MADSDQDVARNLAAARAGSTEALGAALEACRLYLLRTAEGDLDADLRAKGGASDLVQDTFLEAQRDFGQFRGGSEAELLAWLRALLRNNLANFARHYRTTDKRRLDREIQIAADSQAAPTPPIAADTPTPSAEAVADEETRELHAAIRRLPDDYRQILTLRYVEDRPFEEIGAIMQRSSPAVRKLWERAVARLQQELDGPP